MKPLLYLLIFSLTTSCYSQKDTSQSINKKIIWGANIGTILSYNGYGPNRHIYFTAEKRKSLITIGPVWGPQLQIRPTNINPKGNRVWQLNGIHLAYQFHPKPKAKTFEFFFQYQFIFLQYIDRDTDEYIRINNNQGEKYKSTLRSFGNIFGIGYKIKFLKNFYLTQTAGIGIIYESMKVDYETYSDYNTYSYYPDVMTNIALGCTFNFKKKAKENISE